MNKFGVIKTKMLTKLTESYTKENKTEIKNILTTIKENKDFKKAGSLLFRIPQTFRLKAAINKYVN